jgi:hypothetical protein
MPTKREQNHLFQKFKIKCQLLNITITTPDPLSLGHFWKKFTSKLTQAMLGDRMLMFIY